MITQNYSSAETRKPAIYHIILYSPGKSSINYLDRKINKSNQYLAYTHDIVRQSQIKEEVQRVIRSLEANAKKVGLKINEVTTK